MKGYRFPFPFDRSYIPYNRNRYCVRLYYGTVHYSSPKHVIDKVGQHIIYVEEVFNFKGDFDKNKLDNFTDRLVSKLENKVLSFWNDYPDAHVRLHGTISELIVSDCGVGYWNKSDYVKLKHIPKNELKYLQW